jgi:magnesium transporter
MLKMYRDDENDWHKTGQSLSKGIIWIDLQSPTKEEVEFVERLATVRIPSREALEEIEQSSRLILEHDLLYLSTPAVSHDLGGETHLTPVGFIVGPHLLVTVRFSDLPTFDEMAQKIAADNSLQSGMNVFASLLEALVDRGADVLEKLGSAVDQLSKAVFKGGLAKRGPARSTRQLRTALGQVGSLADRLAQARDVLLGVGRIASFAADVRRDWIGAECSARLTAVCKDVASLSDYESRLSDKIQLVLDAVLGFISIEQNDLFKILTIVSVVGIPPTLLAGVWGMNFHNMPELNWEWGYPMAWLVIIASGLLPLGWFKYRGWLD